MKSLERLLGREDGRGGGGERKKGAEGRGGCVGGWVGGGREGGEGHLLLFLLD